MRMVPVRDLMTAGSLAVPFTVAIILILVALGLEWSWPRMAEPTNPWVVGWIAVLGLSLVALPEGPARDWANKTGGRFPPWDRFLVLLIGLSIIVGLWKRGRVWNRGWWPALLASLFLVQGVVGASLHPLDLGRSDMLGNIRQWTSQLLIGSNPYEVFADQTSKILYLPGMHLLHLPGTLLGMEVRSVPTIAGAVALGILTGSRFKPSNWTLVGIAGIFLGPYLFYRDDLYVQVLWVVAGLAVWALAAGKDRAAGLLWGLGFASREWFWLMTPLWVVFLGRTMNRRRVWTVVGWAAGLVAVLWLPFFASDPGGIFRSWTIHGPRIEAANQETLLVHTVDFGLSWIPILLGSRAMSLRIAILAYGLVLYRAVGRVRELRDFCLWGALSVTAFQLFISVVEPYHFLLPAYFLVLGSSLARPVKKS